MKYIALLFCTLFTLQSFSMKRPRNTNEHTLPVATPQNPISINVCSSVPNVTITNDEYDQKNIKCQTTMTPIPVNSELTNHPLTTTQFTKKVVSILTINEASPRNIILPINTRIKFFDTLSIVVSSYKKDKTPKIITILNTSTNQILFHLPTTHTSVKIGKKIKGPQPGGSLTFRNKNLPYLTINTIQRQKEIIPNPEEFNLSSIEKMAFQKYSTLLTSLATTLKKSTETTVNINGSDRDEKIIDTVISFDAAYALQPLKIRFHDSLVQLNNILDQPNNIITFELSENKETILVSYNNVFLAFLYTKMSNLYT